MKETEQRIGSIAGIAYGGTLLVALILITPPFLGGPPDTLDPSNAEARVRLIAGLSATNIALLRIGFPLEFLNVPLLIVAFVALYRGLAQGKRFFALVALTSAVSSAAFLLIGHFQRFLVLDLGQRYGAADAVHKAGLGAVAVLGENLTQSADMAFNVLLGTGLVFFALAMRSSSFPRWLRDLDLGRRRFEPCKRAVIGHRLAAWIRLAPGTGCLRWMDPSARIRPAAASPSGRS